VQLEHSLPRTSTVTAKKQPSGRSKTSFLLWTTSLSVFGSPLWWGQPNGSRGMATQDRYVSQPHHFFPTQVQPNAVSILSALENYLQHSHSNGSLNGGGLGLPQATASNIVSAFLAVSYFTPIPAALLADSWLGRYKGLVLFYMSVYSNRSLSLSGS